LYLALRAADRFFEKNARWPGDLKTYDDDESDVLFSDQEKVFSELVQLSMEYNIDKNLIENVHHSNRDVAFDVDNQTKKMLLVDDENNNYGNSIENNDDNKVQLLTRKHAEEIVRYGGCELHTISAVVGGVAAQEAVKVLTHQYVPLNNTYVYNGICCVGACYEF
jgi:hypothetical protein